MAGDRLRLDRHLARNGETITLQRLQFVAGVQTVAASVSCRAVVRGYRPTELIGGITQQDSMVVLSPTEIIAAAWTSGRPAHEDTRVPQKGNRAVIAGRVRSVEAAVGIYVAGELVRIEMQVR